MAGAQRQQLPGRLPRCVAPLRARAAGSGGSSSFIFFIIILYSPRCARAASPTGARYDYDSIKDLHPQLERFWPDLQHPNSGGSSYLWSHEWSKHGTCAADGTMSAISDQYSFFAYALNTHSNMPYEAALQNAGIVASHDAVYSKDQITSALRNAFNFTVILSCDDYHGSYSLQRLYSCIDKSGALITCPSQVTQGLESRARCGSGDKIRFPPINH